MLEKKMVILQFLIRIIFNGFFIVLMFLSVFKREYLYFHEGFFPIMYVFLIVVYIRVLFYLGIDKGIPFWWDKGIVFYVLDKSLGKYHSSLYRFFLLEYSYYRLYILLSCITVYYLSIYNFLTTYVPFYYPIYDFINWMLHEFSCLIGEAHAMEPDQKKEEYVSAANVKENLFNDNNKMHPVLAKEVLDAVLLKKSITMEGVKFIGTSSLISVLFAASVTNSVYGVQHLREQGIASSARQFLAPSYYRDYPRNIAVSSENMKSLLDCLKRGKPGDYEQCVDFTRSISSATYSQYKDAIMTAQHEGFSNFIKNKEIKE
jgi:hypothetical protein